MVYVSPLYPAKTQNGSPRITDWSKMLMSASTLKCHKMLLVSHFYKIVINIGHYYPQGPPTDTWIKNLTIQFELNTIECHMTSPKQTFAIYPRLN